MIEVSVEQRADVVECFRHEGEDCCRCDGSGYRPRKCCAGCGEPAGHPSKGGAVLMGLRNERNREQPMYCLECHPELSGLGDVETLDRLQV